MTPATWNAQPYHSASDETYLQHVPGLSILGLFIHLRLILLQCKWMRLNKHDRILLCSQKFATWRLLRLRNKNTSWCLIGKLHCMKSHRCKTPTCIFRHPRQIFLENFESHRRVRRSAAWQCEHRAHRDKTLQATSEKNVFRPQGKSDFAVAQRIYIRKYPKSAQTWISVSSTFWY